MPQKKRRIPAGARPARRPLRGGGGTADGYLQGGLFYPFEASLGDSDFSGAAYADSSVDCSSDSGGSDGYGSGSSYDSGSSSGSYDSGSSGCDSGGY